MNIVKGNNLKKLGMITVLLSQSRMVTQSVYKFDNVCAATVYVKTSSDYFSQNLFKLRRDRRKK